MSAKVVSQGKDDRVPDPESPRQSDDTHVAESPRRQTDPEMEGLSLYERKALLVNRELAAQGMGRYQWAVFFLCGFGYLLDLLWAQAFGLVLAQIQQEFGFSDGQSGNLSTAFSAGLTAGAFFWGFIVDIIGRYYAFNFTVLVSSIFGICLGAPNTYNALLVLAAFTGVGIGGNIPIDTTIVLELLPTKNRWLLPSLSIFQPIGVVICSALAFALVPSHSCATDLKACSQVAAGQACCTKDMNYGWRYLFFTLGAITIFIFFLRFALFNFKESPKFLLYRGRDEEALQTLQYIANYNKVPCNLTLEDFSNLTDDDESISSNSSSQKGRIVLGSGDKQKNMSLKDKLKLEALRLQVLFGSTPMAWLTICIWIIYMFDYWGFTIAGTYLPLILQREGNELGLSLRQTYLSYIYIYIFGIPAVVLGAAIYRWRQLSMLISSALFAAMLFTFTTVSDEASYIGVSGLVYFFQSIFNAILYGSTPEFFPAPIRGTACGIASFWGRLFSIIAPIAAAQVLNTSRNGVLYMAGGGAVISTVFICLLPRRYLGGQSY